MYLCNSFSRELSGGCKPVGSHSTSTREHGEAKISEREMRTAETATRSRPRLPNPTHLCVRPVLFAEAPFTNCFGMNGGDDGTRTRGLCRDGGAFHDNSLSLNGNDSPLLCFKERQGPA
jgi:hypothetical protein